MRARSPLTQGDELRNFEEQFTDTFSLGTSVAISNAASAFHILSEILDLKADDEVICPAHTYCASVYPFENWRENRFR